MTYPPWWKGARGEWFVAAQVVLIVLLLLGPRTVPGWPPFPFPLFFQVAGAVLAVFGALLFFAGLLGLGRRNLTPLPYPRDEGTLVTTGPYALVRHPIYGGAVLLGFGWAFWVRGLLTLVYAVLILVFIDFKARREEEWLKERFADYPAYQARVRKLIPFLW